MHFELFRDANSKWRARLKFVNGRVFMSSEAYSNRYELEDSLASAANAIWQNGVSMSVVVQHGEEQGAELLTLSDYLER